MFHRKLADADDHAREMMTSVAKAEEAAHQQNVSCTSPKGTRQNSSSPTEFKIKKKKFDKIQVA